MSERDDVPPGNRGRASDADALERLEVVIRDLADRYRVLRRDHAALQRALVERDARLRALDARVRESNQARQDAVKRIDDLVAQLEHVEGQLERRYGARAEAP